MNNELIIVGAVKDRLS